MKVEKGTQLEFCPFVQSIVLINYSKENNEKKEARAFFFISYLI